MKLRFFLTGIILHIFAISYSQTINDISKVVLGVRFLDGISQETISLQPILENKLIMFAAKSGYSSFGTNIFFISPEVIVNNVDIAEGGMKNVYVIHGELYLTIQDSTSGTVYSSHSYSFKGSGTKKETAIKNAVLNIKFENVRDLFDEAKEKILSYYKQQQNVIFTRAETCAKNGNYDEAITCLMMIPEELTELHIQALEKAQEIYDQRNAFIERQRIEELFKNNESILMEANSLLATHKPQEALTVMWNYRSGNEEQDMQYATLVNKAEGLVSAAEKEALRKEERAYHDGKEKEMREWEESTAETAHKRDMERKEMELKNNIVASAERVAHDHISVKRQEVVANERIALYKTNVDTQKIDALKTIACEYIRNNPNKDYVHTKY